jgi:beta-lactamase class A
MSSGKRSLVKEVEEIVSSAPGRMGVSIRLVGQGQIVQIRSDEILPLASVYKVPLLATLFHKVDGGKERLDRRVELKEIDKSLGSDLQYFRTGARLTVHDLCYLMIVHSDNTATDMVHRIVGLEEPNRYLRELGLDDIDIYCPNREYFLVFIGWSRRFKGKSLGEIARIWKKMSRKERVDLYAEVRRETRYKSAEEAQRRTVELYGISDEKETKEIRDSSEIMDNHGSSDDIARLLELIAMNKIASPRLTAQMLEYMFLCDSREGLPAKIPDGVRVANKTGGVPGTVNDSALIFASRRNTVACVCLSKGVKYADRKEAREAIAEIGLLAYNAFRR